MTAPLEPKDLTAEPLGPSVGMSSPPRRSCPRCGGWIVTDGTYVACTEQTCGWFHIVSHWGKP